MRRSFVGWVQLGSLQFSSLVFAVTGQVEWYSKWINPRAGTGPRAFPSGTRGLRRRHHGRRGEQHEGDQGGNQGAHLRSVAEIDGG